MTFKIFSDIIESLGKIANTIKNVSAIPAQHRTEIRENLDETFRLMDVTLSMVIVRLSEVVRIEDANQFTTEVQNLSYHRDWITAEREFRLCKSLRHALSESDRLSQKMVNSIAIKEWDTLKAGLHQIMNGEAQLADYIANCFRTLEQQALNANTSEADVKKQLRSLAAALSDERRKLIQAELDLYNFI